jgi:chemotaxis protein MotA
MDFMTVIGFFGGIGAVYYVMHSGGIAGLLLNGEAAVLVFAGTFCSMLISYPLRLIKKVPSAIAIVLFPPKTYAPERIIPILVNLSEKSKKEGIASMQDEVSKIDDVFLRDAIQMVIDRTDPEILRDNLNKEIAFTRERHSEIGNIFRTMATYSPIFGLLGTLIGVVQVLKNLSDPASLGLSMSVAVTATFYGISGANFVFLPICTKLQVISDRELLVKDVIIEGILSIQKGDIPLVIMQKLKAYLAYKTRQSAL